MQRKNIWRRLETARVRQNRVITGYIEFKHPAVYKEAEEFYAQLNTRYPNKKDLRRTNEFEWVKSGFTTVKTKKYYPRKTPYEKKKDNSKPDEIVDNMELIIPLMGRAEKTVENTETTAKTNQKVMENVVDISADKEIEVFIEPPIDSFTDIPIEPTEVIIDSFPVISDKAIDDIIKDLREDPDLDQIFNEFDVDFDDFDEEESPLERELANW